MHPSQMGPFRKTVIALLTLLFTGALLVFTGQANLDLLKSVYPNPQFYMFGLLALEGGVIYWTGYYLLNPSGTHKAMAIFALAIDATLSGTGFFYEMEAITKSIGVISLPPIILVVGFAIIFNVGMSIVSHLIPTHNGGGMYALPQPKPKQEEDWARGYTGEQRALAQEATVGGDTQPNFLMQGVSSLIAATQDTVELAQEKRKRGRPRSKEEGQAGEVPTNSTPEIPQASTQPA